MTYEELIIESNVSDIYELDMQLKGLYADGVIGISKHLPAVEKKCVLAEELGHLHTSSGDILDQTCVCNRKQERKARAWGYECILPLNRFIDAYKHRCHDFNDVAEFLDVSCDYLQSALDYYHQKHGKYFVIGKYVIGFEPFGIIEKF